MPYMDATYLTSLEVWYKTISLFWILVKLLEPSHSTECPAFLVLPSWDKLEETWCPKDLSCCYSQS